jgi:hypothetical protein
MPTLAAPIALVGLAALIPLTVLYLLFRRPRVREVSSLLLWEGLARIQEGGGRVERLRTPLSYILEVLTILLLALAAASPLIPLGHARRPLVVVLDNSLSMSATDAQNTSVRERAQAALSTLLRDEPAPRYVLAGVRPRALARDVTPQLSPWNASEPSADLLGAITLARDLGGPRARLLVVTDRAPAASGVPEPLDPEVRWLSVASPASNAAIVSAVRDESTVQVEVRQFGAAPWRGVLTLSFADDPSQTPLHTAQIALEPGGRERVRVALRAPGRAVVASIDTQDPLAFDNRVTLAPVDRPPLRASVQHANAATASAIERAITSSGFASVTSSAPEIIFTDGPAAPTDATWIVRFARITGTPRVSAAPFVVDQTHPVGQGLELDGVLWAAPTEPRAPDPAELPIVVGSAGELVLERRADEGGRVLSLRLDPARSNITSHPSWPVLVWNCLAWRDAHRPGPASANVLIGQIATIRSAAAVSLTTPSGETRELRPSAGAASIDTSEPGLYGVRIGADTSVFAVLPIAPAESDLSATSQADLGAWQGPTEGSTDVRSVAWAVALAALAVLLGHGLLFAARRGQRA